MHALATQVASMLSRNWWVLLLRGLLAIAFAILTWTRPGASLAALVTLFGAYALVDGILGAWAAIAGRKQHEDWWAMLLWGLLGIVVGILTFAAPGLTALALQFYIAIWAISTGILQIVVAIRLRHEIQGEFWLVLAGLASVLFGGVLVAQPGAGALALLWLIAIYAFAFGLLLVMLAFKMKGLAGRLATA